MRHLLFQMLHRMAAFARAWLHRATPDLRPLDQRVRESGEW